MSQVKVDYKKEMKHNRKKLVKQNKIKRAAGWACGIAILIAACGWIGYSSYSKYEEVKSEEVVSTAVDISPISDYVSSLTATDAAK